MWEDGRVPSPVEQRGRFLDVAVVLVPVLVAVAALAPFVALDPIRGVTFSNGPFTDEAWYVANARNWAVFGSFATDEWSLYLGSLPFAIVEGLVFRVFGVGLIQARLVDVACVAATAGLIGGALRPLFGRGSAMLAGTGYATCALILFHGRTAIVDPMSGLFLTAGLLTITRIDGRRPGGWGVVGGACLAVAVMTKATTAPAVAVAIGVVVVAGLARPGARRWAVAAIAVIGVAAISWLLAIALQNQKALADMLDKIYPHLPRPTPRRLLHRLVAFIGSGFDGAAVLSAPLLVFAVAGFVAALRRRRAMTTAALTLILATAAAFGVSMLAIALAGYWPNRYAVTFAPLLAILTAPATREVLRMSRSLAARRGSDARRASAAAVLIMAVVLVAPGVWSQATWVAAAGHRVLDAQDESAAVLPDGSTVAGYYAPLLAMTSRAYAVVTCCEKVPVNAGDLYEAGARWWADVEPPAPTTIPSGVWARRELVTCVNDWSSRPRPLCLWRLP